MLKTQGKDLCTVIMDEQGEIHLSVNPDCEFYLNESEYFIINNNKLIKISFDIADRLEKKDDIVEGENDDFKI